MAYKAYVNNFNKELQIGSNSRHIKFKNGFFATEDPEIQAKIESSQGFGVNIHFQDTLEEMERMGRERQEKEGAEKARKRKEFLAEMEAEEKVAAEAKIKEEVKVERTEAKSKINKRLAAADRVL